MTIFTDGLRLGVGHGIDELHASMGEYLGAEAGEAFENLPVVSLRRMGELTEAGGQRLEADPDNFTPEGLPQMRLSKPSADIPDVSIDQARARVKDAGLDKVLHLPEQPSFKAPALDIMLNRARERNERAATMSRGPGGIIPGALGVGTSLLVSAIDPLNLAAAFIPVVGEARYAKLMASAGESVIARAGVRAGVGAGSGAVGMAVLEPLDYAARRQEGQDYGMADALRAVLYGAAFGSVLHTAGGGIADVYRGRKGKPVFPFAPGEAFERPADGQSGPGARQNPFEDPAPAADGVQPGYTRPAGAAGPFDDAPAARPAATPASDKPLSLHEFIAAQGGVSEKDPLVADLLQSFGGKAPTIKGRGRMVRPDGKSLDELREAAVEAGYLHDPAREHGGVTQSSIDDLLQAVDAEARGGKIYPAGAEPAPSRADLAHAREEELAYREKFIVEARQDIQTAIADHELSDQLKPQVAHRALRIMQEDDIGPRLAVEHAMAEYGVKPSVHPVMAGLADLPPRAKEDVMRASIARLIDGEPVNAGEMLQAAAKTDPRIAESLNLWEGARENPRATMPADDWHELAQRKPDFDEPAIADASKAADAAPEPPSLAREPSARVAAAEKSLAEAEAVYKANEDYVPDEVKAKLDHELAKLDVEASDRAEVIKRGAACLAAAVGVIV